MRRALLIAVLLCCASADAQIDWITFDPLAIRTMRTDPVRLDVQTAASSGIASIRFDLAAGGNLLLTPMGGGRFTANIPAAQALFDYQSDDVNRNFVGFLRMLGSGGQTLSTYNAFVSVVDANVPSVPITSRPGDARQTARILNLRRPLIGTDSRAATQQFYAYFPDEFDFVQVVLALPNFPGNRHHIVIRNDVSGIGLAPTNATAFYGSAGRLIGINVYPIDGLFDAAEANFSHETGHQWINYLDHPRLLPGPHWPPSSMASGIMGFNIPGTNVGGDFSWNVEAATPGFARVTARQGEKEFSDFDLYLMGLIPASQVRDGLLLDGTACHNCTVPATRITINDIINLHGPRLPAHPNTPRSFRFGTVVITRDRLLDDDEMALLEYFAARGESRTSLPYTSGFARGTTKPFYLATRTLATVDLRLARDRRKRSARH